MFILKINPSADNKYRKAIAKGQCIGCRKLKLLSQFLAHSKFFKGIIHVTQIYTN